MSRFRLFLLILSLLCCVPMCSHGPADLPEGARSQVALNGDRETLNCADYKRLIVGQMVLDGKVCQLLIDTGASHTILRRDVVDKLWPDKPVRALGKTDSNLNQSLYCMPVRSLASNSFEARNFYALVADLPQLGSLKGEPVAGLLGMDIMGGCPMMVDVAHGKVTFFSSMPSSSELAAMGAIPVPIKVDGNYIRARLSIDGEPMMFIIDSGATQSCMDIKDWKGVVQRSNSPMQWIDVNGINDKKGFNYGVMKIFNWGGLSLAPQPILFGSYEKIMGGDVLRQGKILIHRRASKAWWIPHV